MLSSDDLLLIYFLFHRKKLMDLVILTEEVPLGII